MNGITILNNFAFLVSSYQCEQVQKTHKVSFERSEPKNQVSSVELDFEAYLKLFYQYKSRPLIGIKSQFT
jgi:formate dehydrogenase maturation protein FdhE